MHTTRGNGAVVGVEKSSSILTPRQLTGSFSVDGIVKERMNVHELRNEIRVAVDRYERMESTGFTKESLAAICEAVGYEIDQNNFPSKDEMRAGILTEVGVFDSPDPTNAPQSFRKSELESIYEAVAE